MEPLLDMIEGGKLAFPEELVTAVDGKWLLLPTKLLPVRTDLEIVAIMVLELNVCGVRESEPDVELDRRNELR